MDNSERSILQKYGVTEELLREEEEKQLKRELWSEGIAFFTGQPENVQQKRAQECLKELSEHRVKPKVSRKLEDEANCFFESG